MRDPQTGFDNLVLEIEIFTVTVNDGTYKGTKDAEEQYVDYMYEMKKREKNTKYLKDGGLYVISPENTKTIYL